MKKYTSSKINFKYIRDKHSVCTEEQATIWYEKLKPFLRYKPYFARLKWEPRDTWNFREPTFREFIDNYGLVFISKEELD